MALISLINSFYGGGAEKQLFLLSQYIKFDKIITLENDNYYGIKNFITLSNNNHKTSKIKKLIYNYIYPKKLKYYTSSNDTIISFMTRANIINIKASFKSKHKTIISEITNPYMEYRGLKKYYFYQIKKYYGFANIIRTQSYGLKETLEKETLHKNIKIIPNALNLDEIKKMADESLNEYGGIFKNPVIINIGRLDNSKNQWRLIKIFHYLKREINDLKLVLLGEGNLKDYLIKLCQAYNLKTFDFNKDLISDNYDVYFLGFQKNPYKFIKRSKIFLFTSNWECFPNALLEAMACGIPVISANCRFGPLEILNDEFSISSYLIQDIEIPSKFGILLPALNPQKIKNSNEKPDKIEKLWIDKVKWMFNTKNVIAYYSKMSELRAKDFDIKKIYPLWENIINEIS